jgi:putative ABC transport system ATP-binding protein
MIRCIDVCKTYRQGGNDITALAGVSLEIAKGSFVAIMGPSGSGKSTLMHLIGGLDRPTSGDLLVHGRLIGQMADDQVTLFRRYKIGFVFQFFNLLPTLTALENVALPLVLDGRSKAESEERAQALLMRTGLDKRRNHLPDELSGGEIQRVAVARALAFNPSILLADEPTGNLDTRTSIEVMGIFQRLNRERGITVLVITHEQDIAEYGTRVILCRDGQIVSDHGVKNRRVAEDELRALPLEEETVA